MISFSSSICLVKTSIVVSTFSTQESGGNVNFAISFDDRNVVIVTDLSAGKKIQVGKI